MQLSCQVSRKQATTAGHERNGPKPVSTTRSQILGVNAMKSKKNVSPTVVLLGQGSTNSRLSPTHASLAASTAPPPLRVSATFAQSRKRVRSPRAVRPDDKTGSKRMQPMSVGLVLSCKSILQKFRDYKDLPTLSPLHAWYTEVTLVHAEDVQSQHSLGDISDDENTGGCEECEEPINTKSEGAFRASVCREDDSVLVITRSESTVSKSASKRDKERMVATHNADETKPGESNAPQDHPDATTSSVAASANSIPVDQMPSTQSVVIQAADSLTAQTTATAACHDTTTGASASGSVLRQPRDASEVLDPSNASRHADLTLTSAASEEDLLSGLFAPPATTTASVPPLTTAAQAHRISTSDATNDDNIPNLAQCARDASAVVDDTVSSAPLVNTQPALEDSEPVLDGLTLSANTGSAIHDAPTTKQAHVASTADGSNGASESYATSNPDASSTAHSNTSSKPNDSKSTAQSSAKSVDSGTSQSNATFNTNNASTAQSTGSQPPMSTAADTCTSTTNHSVANVDATTTTQEHAVVAATSTHAKTAVNPGANEKSRPLERNRRRLSGEESERRSTTSRRDGDDTRRSRRHSSSERDRSRSKRARSNSRDRTRDEYRSSRRRGSTKDGTHRRDASGTDDRSQSRRSSRDRRVVPDRSTRARDHRSADDRNSTQHAPSAPSHRQRTPTGPAVERGSATQHGMVRSTPPVVNASDTGACSTSQSCSQRTPVLPATPTHVTPTHATPTHTTPTRAMPTHRSQQHALAQDVRDSPSYRDIQQLLSMGVEELKAKSDMYKKVSDIGAKSKAPDRGWVTLFKSCICTFVRVHRRRESKRKLDESDCQKWNHVFALLRASADSHHAKYLEPLWYRVLSLVKAKMFAVATGLDASAPPEKRRVHGFTVDVFKLPRMENIDIESFLQEPDKAKQGAVLRKAKKVMHEQHQQLKMARTAVESEFLWQHGT